MQEMASQRPPQADLSGLNEGLGEIRKLIICNKKWQSSSIDEEQEQVLEHGSQCLGSVNRELAFWLQMLMY